MLMPCAYTLLSDNGPVDQVEELATAWLSINLELGLEFINTPVFIAFVTTTVMQKDSITGDYVRGKSRGNAELM